jgi:glycerophosphoryl diester phosphodiesterase
MKVIIAGSRTFNDAIFLFKKCNHALSSQPDIIIVSGTSKGADEIGEEYAEAKRYPLKKFPADWDKYGKSAGYKRNEEMAMYADALIAFWDGKSKGTKHMIDIAHKYNLKVKVYKF